MTDYIKREDAINAFEFDKEYLLDTIADILLDIPSADVVEREQYDTYVALYDSLVKAVDAERMCGRWIRVTADKVVQNAYHFYRCSECGLTAIGEHNFCPRCGVPMTRGNDNE